MSRRFAREVYATKALCTLSLQTCWMVAALTETWRRGLEVFYDRLKMDETKQMLTIKVESLLTANQQRTCWSVCMQGYCVGWVFLDSPGEIRLLPVRPTVMLSARSAGAYHDTLFTQQNVAQMMSCIETMRRCAERCISVREPDGAPPVIKVFQHEQNLMLALQAQKIIFHSVSACCDHPNNLITRTVGNTFRKTVSGMSSYAKTLREGNYFLRQVFSVEKVCVGGDTGNGMLRIRRTPPSPPLHSIILSFLSSLSFGCS